jgi:ferredoxin-NADP reductase
VVLSLPIGGRIHRNAYSLLGDPARRDHWRIAVRRQQSSRGGSAWLHDEARAGMYIDLSPPVNLFSLVRTARHHVLVAGGIGITPILSQARELARLGASFEVHYAFRGPANAVFLDDLKAIAPDRVHPHDSDRDGQLEFGPLRRARRSATHLYICGPQGMVDACMQAGARLAGLRSTCTASSSSRRPAGSPSRSSSSAAASASPCRATCRCWRRSS